MWAYLLSSYSDQARYLCPPISHAADQASRIADPKAGAPEAGSSKALIRGSQVSKLYSDDVDALNDLAYQGKRLFLTDLMRVQARSCLEYCKVSVQKAVEGRIREAIRNGNKALHLAVEKKEEFLLAYSKRDLASAYNIVEKDDIALRLANEAIEHQRRAGLDPQALLTPLYQIRGDIYLRGGDPKKALAEYERAIDIGFRNVRAFVYVSMLRAYLAAGEFDKARGIAKDLMDESAPSFRQAGLIGLGDLEIRQGKPVAAVKHFEAALNVAGAPDFLRLWALEGIGKAHVAQRDSKSAIDSYLRATAAAETLRLNFSGQEFRAGIFGRMKSVFSESVRLLMEDGQTEAAWAVSERGRGRALLDMVRTGIAGSESSAVVSRPLGRVRSLAEVQDALPADSALIQYHVLADRLYAWVIRKNSITGVRIETGGQVLASKIDAFRRAILERAPEAEPLARDLYDVLLKPLALTPGQNAIFITHDYLHYLPFQALHDGSSYVVDTRAISYAPSASVLVELLGREEAKKSRLLAIGNPVLEDPSFALPGAEREVKSIARLFPDSRILLQAQATKLAFIEGAAKSDVLHIAAHSVMDAVDPMYSRILLSGADVLTSELEAHEIYRLNLRHTRLVTLSSCESALGKVTSGDEVWGFPRAFLGAGARSLLVSLWPVSDDSTEKLMVGFYKSFAQQDLRDALRTAQIAVKSDPRYAHPFFWAAFNVIGDWR